MNMEQKRRLAHLMKQCAIYLGIGIAYFVFVKITDIYIPCLIKLITKKYCPGCGISHMLVSLARLDFKGAMSCNILLFIILPFAAIFFVYKAVLYVKHGKVEMSRPEAVGYCIVFVLCVAFWILRNTTAFAFLAPMY